MIRKRWFLMIAVLLIASATLPVAAQLKPEFDRTRRVVYGEKLGMGLLMDVLTPKENANGKAIIFVVSGGWISNPVMIDMLLPEEFLRRGYTVFAVNHGTQPKFSIPEILEDIHRAVRFIRYHAGDYNIDPDKIGIYGGSAGGHLSLMQGTTGTAGDPDAIDPVNRESSRVQAVACFFPPTDFLNYGKEGQVAIGSGILAGFPAPFAFTELNPQTRKYELIEDEARRVEIAREISPINHITEDDAPTLIVHGDADALVPYQQGKIMIDALKAGGVEAELVTKPGAAHGWPDWHLDLKPHADWFDKHLR